MSSILASHRLLVGLGLLLLLQALPAQAARLALVIGNAAYADSPLRNPVNDARAVEAKLQQLGFTVHKVENLKRAQIGRTVSGFASRIRPGDDVVVFYAGHGLQVRGVNYLPAVDAEIQNEDDVPLNSLNVGSLLERLDEAKAGVKLLILDACRNNPYARGFRSASRGLARVADAPGGTLMHFATRPGSVAADGSGANGLYTTELLKAIDLPGVPVELMLKRVAAAVERVSQGQQEPWGEGSLKGDFYFRPPSSATAPALVPPTASTGISLEDLQREEASRQAWNGWQQRMKADFDKTTGFSGSSDLQAMAWDRFLGLWTEDNPISREDDDLRQQARQRLDAARRLAAPSGPSSQVAMITPPVGSLSTGKTLVRIGHVGPTSGAIAHLGLDNENGARLAIEEANAAGVRIGGRELRFELVTDDDGADPKSGVEAARRVVAQGVVGVVGHLNSGTSIPASAVYQQAGIAQISPSATNPKLTRQGFRTTFRLITDDQHASEAFGRYAVQQLGARKIALIDDRTAYGVGVVDAFERAVKAAGAEVVGREFTNDPATDHTAILTSLKARRPDVVFFGGMDSVAGPLLRQMRQMGIDARLLGGDGICSGELVKLAGGADPVDGRVLCYESGGVDGEFTAPMVDFKRRYKARFGMDVQIYAPYTYDAVRVLIDAMRRADSIEPARVLQALARTTGYKGVTGPIAFDDKGDLVRASLTLYGFRRGGERQAQAVLH
ncbi:ABC-type branched-subunit amino acid transport system substrate-binding protein [Sphaerotilus mobilis]|uniref:ABC-type branched-subunit amino acid transport system substrate-binding protein n=2 Tax=Sphaerotilus mobilis TaxID=47994 RepID=A0A4Q7LRT5_9BURK|nr:ABC-type branched-subunit amino acid transport system substrate-binding protein [Sphaerotilus mobilis]